MGFQILNADGKAISMAVLDKEAAEFWGKEVDVKQYADPAPPRKEGESYSTFLKRSMSTNWFDKIGYCIHTQGNDCSGWANIVATMINHVHMAFIDTEFGYNKRPVKLSQVEMELSSDGKEIKNLTLDRNSLIKIWAILDNAKPYIDLINHWQSKGYSPKKVED